jgi:hypothetical protein
MLAGLARRREPSDQVTGRASYPLRPTGRVIVPSERPALRLGHQRSLGKRPDDRIRERPRPITAGEWCGANRRLIAAALVHSEGLYVFLNSILDFWIRVSDGLQRSILSSLGVRSVRPHIPACTERSLLKRPRRHRCANTEPESIDATIPFAFRRLAAALAVWRLGASALSRVSRREPSFAQCSCGFVEAGLEVGERFRFAGARCRVREARTSHLGVPGG